MATENVSAVVPREQAGSIVCECGASMVPTIGHRIDSTNYGLVRWLFWTCAKGHATEALPVPLSLL